MPGTPRSEREALRWRMNSFSSSGRFGDWMSILVTEYPVTAAKVYWMMADDSARAGFSRDEKNFREEATKLWPDVVNWTGRKK